MMPSRSEQRAANRQALRQSHPGRSLVSRGTGNRQYAAAKTSRTTGDWFPVDQNVNELIRSSSPAVRARVRQLVRDFPYFRRAVKVHVDYTVGPQMNFQSRVSEVDKDGIRVYDRKAIQQIEDAVSWAMEEIDVSGKLHYNEMRPLAKKQDMETGEFLFLKTYLKDPNRYIPFALQAIEADWLTDLHAKPQGNNKVDQGIEYDLMTGAVVAYHLADPQNILLPRRVEAQYVLHGFETDRPGQLRGISPFTTAILIANDLSTYIDATIDTAKLAAKYLAIVTTNDVAGFQTARTQPGTGADQGKKLEELENAIIEYLRQGESITFAKPDTVGGTFDPFTKFILRMLAIATGITYELLSGDYSGMNYATLKITRADLVRMFRAPFQRHTLHLDQPVVREIIDQAVLAGRINLPGYYRNQRHYWQSEFIQPGIESPDRLRDSKADATELGNLTTSPQRIVAAKGWDLEKVIAEIAQAKEMAEKQGLTLADVSTALANNPAALGAEEERGVTLSKLSIRQVAEEVREQMELFQEEGNE